jgi:hypothetical protein
MDRAQYAYQYFIKAGWTPVQAAAIVGNLQQESGQGLNPNARNPRDPGTSIGIGQWNRERKANLMAFAAKQGSSPLSFDTQLAFVQNELKGLPDPNSPGKTLPLPGAMSEAGVGGRLAQATDMTSAMKHAIGYERPVGWSANNPMGGHGWSNRLSNALALSGSYKVPAQGDQPAAYSGGQFVDAFKYNLPAMMTQPGAYSGGEYVPPFQYDTNPTGQTVVSAAGDPPSTEPLSLMQKIFGSFGKAPEPYWMKNSKMDEEAKKAYMAQGLQDQGWPSLRSYLG